MHLPFICKQVSELADNQPGRAKETDKKTSCNNHVVHMHVFESTYNRMFHKLYVFEILSIYQCDISCYNIYTFFGRIKRLNSSLDSS